MSSKYQAFKYQLFAAVLAVTGCTGETPQPIEAELWPSQVSLAALRPVLIVPQTRIHIDGQGFVSRALGTTRIRFTGTTIGVNQSRFDINFSALVDVSQSTTIELTTDQSFLSKLCPNGDGRFEGFVSIEVASVRTNQVHVPSQLNVAIECKSSLTPKLNRIGSGQTYVNGRVDIQGHDLLLGGEEGQSFVLVSGCFLPNGQTPPCAQDNGKIVDQVRLPLTIKDTVNRRDAFFIIGPNVGGIQAGKFVDGRVRLVNVNNAQTQTTSELQFWEFDRLASRLEGIGNTSASLGGYMELNGQGFIGSGSDELAELTVDGLFTPTSNSGDNGRVVPVRARLLPEYRSGNQLRYLLNEEDELGRAIDLRTQYGVLRGQFSLRMARGDEELILPTLSTEVRLAPVRQVVYVIFTQGYRDALARFGLRQAEPLVSARIIDTARQVYQGIGVEFRTERPDDYALYAEVEITGVDPNGIGLIGYDNTPGKDVDNKRLYDRIGGANAETQADNFPGYGGIFLESYFGFSKHPPIGVKANPGASDVFDQIFDPLRPDQDGVSATENEIRGAQQRTQGQGCPAISGSRSDIVSCAIFVLGNLLGGTMAHEVAHSLGLADPDGDAFHNPVDRPFHLMDAGFDRPFVERAQLLGSGPEYFCLENFQYLQKILPTGESDPQPSRTTCR